MDRGRATGRGNGGFDMSLKALAFGAAALTALSAGSAAANDWSGAYVGVFGAYSQTDSTFTDNGYNGNVSFLIESTENWGGGATLGFNAQPWDYIVVGIEAELGWIDMDGFRVEPGAPGGDTAASTEGGFYGIGAVRAGVTPWADVLIYAKAGVAIVDTGARVNDTCAVGPCGPALVVGEPGNMEEGWAFGGGVEVAVHSNWTLKAEYLRIDLESGTIPLFRTNAPIGFVPENFSHEHDIDTIKIGLNYGF